MAIALLAEHRKADGLYRALIDAEPIRPFPGELQCVARFGHVVFIPDGGIARDIDVWGIHELAGHYGRTGNECQANASKAFIAWAARAGDAS